MRINSFSFQQTCRRVAPISHPVFSKPSHSGSPLQSSRGANLIHKSFSHKFQNSFDKMAVTDMERGIGGRIEAAFESAKVKGEAAFITFITAGYPNAQGRSIYGGGRDNIL